MNGNEWKNFEKNNPKLLLMCYMLKKWIYVLPTFKKTIQILEKKKIIFFNNFKE